EANSLDQFVRPAAFRLAGPAIAGWVIAAGGTGGAFLLDAATFVASAVCVLSMKGGCAAPASEAGPGAVRAVRQGCRVVAWRVWRWGTFAVAALAYLLFMGPTEVLLPYVVKHQLGGGPEALGFVFAMGGLGAIAGALVMGQLGLPRRHVTFMYVAWTLATLAVG